MPDLHPDPEVSGQVRTADPGQGRLVTAPRPTVNRPSDAVPRVKLMMRKRWLTQATLTPFVGGNWTPGAPVAYRPSFHRTRRQANRQADRLRRSFSPMVGMLTVTITRNADRGTGPAA